MKAKLRIILITVIACIICISLAGCRVDNWQFEQGIESISSIELINVKDIDFMYWPDLKVSELIDGSFEFEIKKEIPEENYQEIINKIQGSVVYRYFGTPVDGPHGIGFKVTYSNGDFDLLTYFEPIHLYLREDGTYIGNMWGLSFGDAFYELVAEWSS